jgi:hypothetical protein
LEGIYLKPYRSDIAERTPSGGPIHKMHTFQSACHRVYNVHILYREYSLYRIKSTKRAYRAIRA